MSGDRDSRWDRRQLIQAALGAAAAAMIAPGCSDSANESLPLPPGKLVGASIDLGHRIRDAALRRQAASQVTPAREANATEAQATETQATESTGDIRRVRVAIVGGGVAGLIAARELQRLGLSDFVVLELESRAGGTATGDESLDDFRVPIPWGAHYLPAPTNENPALVEFLQELGAFDGSDEQGEPRPREDWSPRAPESRFWFRGSWYDGLYAWPGASAADLAELERFEAEINRWVLWRDTEGRRAFTIPADRGSRDPLIQQLDTLDMRSWLQQQGFQSERLFEFVDHACRDDYGLTVEATSAWAGIYYFAARRSAPGVPSRPYLTWPQGNGYLTARLAERCGERLQTGWGVSKITPIESVTRVDEHVVEGDTIRSNSEDVNSEDVNSEDVNTANANSASSWLELTALDAKGVQRVWHAERVIFAAPTFLAPWLISGFGDAACRSSANEQASAGASDQSREMLENRREAVRHFRYAAWVVANIALDPAPMENGHPIAWDNVIHGSQSLGFLATSYQRGFDRGSAVWTWYYPLSAGELTEERRRLAESGREAWAEIVLTDLERPYPEIRKLVQRIDVMRWGHAMIQPVPGFRFGAARTQATQPWRGVYFAHSDTSGLPLFEEAFARGREVAKQLIDELGLSVKL